MVNSVSSSSPTDFLTQIKTVPPVKTATPAATTTGTTTANPASTAAANTASSAENTAVQMASTLLDLINNMSSSSANSTLTGGLVGGVSSTDPLAGVYNSMMFSQSTTKPLQEALAVTQQQQAQTAAQSTSVQDLLTARNAASNAYNNTLIQQAQAAVTAAKKPIVA